MALAGALACRRPEPERGERRSAPDQAHAALATPPPSVDAPFQTLALCRVDHGGSFLDLGSDASQARRSFSLGPFADVTSDSWGDQSFSRYSSPFVAYDFWLREPREDIEVRVRAKAGSSSRLTASIDQTRLGSVRIRGEGFHTLTFPRPKAALGPGRHELGLRWSGRPAGEGRALGMIEWIHWADPGQPAREYRPPRYRSLIDDVVLGGAPRRSIVLEAPGSLSCPVLLARDATLELGVGYHGEGSGVARVLARRAGAPPIVLAERRVNGGPGEGWADLSLDLAPLGHQLVELELEARSERASGRIAFSQPRLKARQSPVSSPRAKLAVLVVLSGLHRELLPPFEGTRRLRHINQLAAASARYPEYRVPTSVVGGVMATLLSGLPPRAHTLESSTSRLPRQVLTLADRLRETSGESAFFSGVPQTREAFGFGRGWNEFEEFSPVSDVAATAPLEHARAWLERALERGREVPRLLVLHLRGAHPPWDLSREEVAELEPRDYLGLLEARRGGMILSGVRNNPRPAQRRLAPADWVRLEALQLAALQKLDVALGSLLELLEREHVYDDSLIALAGDVAMGDAPEAPFGDARPLTEDRLVVPLWIKFPRSQFGGSEIPGAVTSSDVAATLARALGVSLPGELRSVDLYQLAAGAGPALTRGLLATLGREYSLRLGPWLLHGQSPRPPMLCELGVDPACVHDVLGVSPLPAETLWRMTFEVLRRERSLESAVPAPEPAALDKDTAAALKVWGD